MSTENAPLNSTKLQLGVLLNKGRNSLSRGSTSNVEGPAQHVAANRVRRKRFDDDVVHSST